MEFIVNITQHIYVPAHRQLSSSEADEVCARYSASMDDFPRLLRTDPVCRYYNFPKGCIVEIRRAPIREQVYYRVVCDAA